VSNDTPEKKKKRKKRQSKEPELLRWGATFSAVEQLTSFTAAGRKDEPPHLGSMASLTLIGTLDEPLQNNVREIELSVQGRDTDKDVVSTTPGMRNGTEPYHPWIGFLDTRPPKVGATVFLPATMFETVWAMTNAGNVKHAHLTLTKPHYGRHGLRNRGILPLVAMRRTAHGSGLGHWRWVVERTFAWLNQFRRLRVRYDKRVDIHEAFLSLTCTLICWRALRKRSRPVERVAPSCLCPEPLHR